jgi:hypothetical protein
MVNVRFKPVVIIIITCLFTLSVQAQSLWRDVPIKNTDPRFTITAKHYYSTSGDNDEVKFYVQNNTATEYMLVVDVTINWTCNRSSTFKLGYNKQVYLKPNGKFDAFSNDWIHSQTTTDKNCIIKADEKTYTTILSVSTNVTDVKDVAAEKAAKANQTKPGQIDKPSGSSNQTDGQTTKTTNVPANAASGSCPAYNFSLSGEPSINCASFEWFAIPTRTNSVDAAGNFKQNKGPVAASFIVQYRKQGASSWFDDPKSNSFRNLHAITGLDACTKYEARLITICESGARSEPSPILRFSTACTPPGDLVIENITKNSATVGGRIHSVPYSYPCESPKKWVRVIEYKSSKTQWWEETICNSGSACIINALNPATTYRVRAKYKYDNVFSGYTNEVSFTTR